MAVSAQRVAVFAEVHSSNLGDGVIYNCISHLFGRHGVTTIPVDLSGRPDLVFTAGFGNKASGAGRLRRLARQPFQRSRQLGRLHSALRWYALERRRQMRQWGDAIRACDAVVVGGGQILTDRRLRFPPRIYEVARLAKLYGKPLAIFGCGSDSHWGYLASRLYSEVLQQAVYVSVRDQNSASFLSGHLPCGVPLDVHPDPAFAVRRLVPRSEDLKHTDVVGVNLQPVNDFRQHVPALRALTEHHYFEFWSKVILGASTSGRQIRLLTNGSREDYSTAQKFVSHQQKKGATVDLEPRPAHVDQLLEQMDKLSSVVCTRMHAGIVAQGLGKRVAAIAWDPKVSAVWRQVDGVKTVVAAETLMSPDPWPAIDRVLADQSTDLFDLPKHTASIEAAVRRCLGSLGFSI